MGGELVTLALVQGDSGMDENRSSFGSRMRAQMFDDLRSAQIREVQIQNDDVRSGGSSAIHSSASIAGAEHLKSLFQKGNGEQFEQRRFIVNDEDGFEF